MVSDELHQKVYRRYHLKVIGLPNMTEQDRNDMITCIKSCVSATTGTDTVPENVTVEIPPDETVVISVEVEPKDGTMLSEEAVASLRLQLEVLLNTGLTTVTGKSSKTILSVEPPPSPRG